MINGMLHLHIMSWVVLLIVFFAAYENFSDRLGPSQYFKPLMMLLRVFALLAVVSGCYIFFKAMNADAMLYGIKFLLGLLTIGLMEMTLARKKRKKPSRNFFYMVIVAAIITIGLGVHLPLGPITAMFK
ncbi:YisL family protein [Macrococcus capreoli]|uniref:YisL family protein n=1 Tax=Macrococcus capreoli TaxID=2982690 RepID=UPI003EE46AB3